jgi:hypothetical protein
MQYIDQHPEEHDQSHWAFKPDKGCGTACCFAGTALVRAGWRPLFNPWDTGTRNGEPGTVASRFADSAAPYSRARSRPALVAAKELLNLSERDADKLFDGYNSVHDLRWMVERLTRGAYVPPDPD